MKNKTIARIMVERRGAAGAKVEAVHELEGPGTFVIGRLADRNIVLDDPSVSRAHAEITITDLAVTITDQKSAAGTQIDGARVASGIWRPGQTVQIGPFSLKLEVIKENSIHAETAVLPKANGRAAPAAVAGAAAPAAAPRRLETPPSPARPLPSVAPVQARSADATRTEFPGALFAEATVAFRKIQESGMLAGETMYLAIGGGLGSFVWVDHLRVFGVAANDIRVLGLAPEKKPHAKYQRLCRNSQIPDYERLRSNSISAPDNIWGFPGYASRETIKDLARGRIGAFKHVFQVFGEPALAESYTPRTSDVFNSLDKEAARIGWDGMWVHARVMAIRKTDDGRYAVAYRIPSASAGQSSSQRNRIYVARHVHLATGYPAHNYLRDLQDFRHANPQSTAVVNAYEEHDKIYFELEKNGGTALVRGRGIVASRILQRLNDTRLKNPNIRVLHQMRTPTKVGSKYDLARRPVSNNTEYQPFNWPKSCWGGSLRKLLENSTPEERQKLLAVWGGTTTAERSDWDQLIEDGTRDGWYKVFFGDVKDMRLENGKVVAKLASRDGYKENIDISADYVIDCTGVVAKLEEAPLYRDLFGTYDIPRNKVSGGGIEQRLSGIAVNNSFEVAALRNGKGSLYAAGVVVSNGPYAAVDSFLGLQFAALRAVDHLYSIGAPGVSSFGPLRSFRQWLRWCRGAAP